jgi:hypothetical protein
LAFLGTDGTVFDFQRDEEAPRPTMSPERPKNLAWRRHEPLRKRSSLVDDLPAAAE